MTREQRNPYVVLGIGRQASAAEIARAYRRAARATHPDTSSGGQASTERFRAVSDAYETLRDPQRRAAYDRAHPLARRIGPAAPAATARSVRYGSPDGQHIVLGPRARTSSSQLSDEAAATLARLVLSLLRARA